MPLFSARSALATPGCAAVPPAAARDRCSAAHTYGAAPNRKRHGNRPVANPPAATACGQRPLRLHPESRPSHPYPAQYPVPAPRRARQTRRTRHSYTCVSCPAIPGHHRFASERASTSTAWRTTPSTPPARRKSSSARSSWCECALAPPPIPMPAPRRAVHGRRGDRCRCSRRWARFRGVHGPPSHALPVRYRVPAGCGRFRA